MNKCAAAQGRTEEVVMEGGGARLKAGRTIMDKKEKLALLVNF